MLGLKLNHVSSFTDHDLIWDLYIFLIFKGVSCVSYLICVTDTKHFECMKWESVRLYQPHHSVSFFACRVNHTQSDPHKGLACHNSDVTMGSMASQITSLAIVYPTVYSGADQWKHESSASLASVRRIHRWPVNSPHKWPVTWKMFPFDDVIMRKLFHTMASSRGI